MEWGRQKWKLVSILGSVQRSNPSSKEQAIKKTPGKWKFFCFLFLFFPVAEKGKKKEKEKLDQNDRGSK